MRLLLVGDTGTHYTYRGASLLRGNTPTHLICINNRRHVVATLRNLKTTGIPDT